MWGGEAGVLGKSIEKGKHRAVAESLLRRLN